MDLKGIEWVELTRELWDSLEEDRPFLVKHKGDQRYGVASKAVSGYEDSPGVMETWMGGDRYMVMYADEVTHIALVDLPWGAS